MNYYDEIKNKIIDNEIYAKVKDYSKERHKVIINLEIGRLLNEAGGKYGDNIIDDYSKKLKEDLNKVYSYRSLNYMIRYYEFQKMQSVTANLSWGHYLE